jgi:C4-dicarboxylate-specific signal transduction histidine kinase
LRWLTVDPPNLEEARASALSIVKEGMRAAKIISRIRLLFQKGTPQRESVDVNEIIREMIVLLRSEVTRHSISVRAELAADLPEVMGDRVQLQQVMMNLITNSIDAMKAVDGTRELAIKSQRAEHDHLMVCVSDTGVGLPPQQADQIFSAFFTTKPHGTGMGLMHASPAHEWTVAELAAEARVSRSSLSALFRRLVGVSPMAYLARWRLLLAARILHDEGLSIREAADRVGYEADAAFSRAFKRQFGVAPSRYRERALH